MSFESLIGKFTSYEYPIGGKSVETRMRVFSDQLINDLLIEEEMDQWRKSHSYDFILRKLNHLYMLGSKNGTSYEDAHNFKHQVREQLVKLVFKQVR